MSDDKLEALECFENCMSDTEPDAILDLFSFDDDKEAAKEKLGGEI